MQGSTRRDPNGSDTSGNWQTPVAAPVVNVRFQQSPNGPGTPTFRVVNLVGTTTTDVVNYVNSVNTNAQAAALASNGFIGGTGACQPSPISSGPTAAP